LGQLADIRLARGAPSIKSENARPNAWVYVDLKTSDIGGFVEEAKKVVAGRVDIPAGYTITWSGQYEYMERASARLRIVIPLTLCLIFLLLYFNFRNVAAPAVVMLSVPFGLIGRVSISRSPWPLDSLRWPAWLWKLVFSF
jgi:Cu(I)/Ag(I) efflux system membrane protein CusA/SilA